MAEGVRQRLEDLGIFKAVRKAAISNGGQIWVSKDVLNILPAAIVCIGNGAFESFGLVRKPSLLIIIADNFKADTEAKAEGIWPLLDKVFASFVPQVATGEAPEMPVIDGVEYELKNFSPIDSSERIVAFGIEIEGSDSAVT